MVEEMAALEKNATWDSVPLPDGKRTVGCRWIVTVKHKVDGIVKRFKARLVAKGYTQSYIVDYQEIFAPVAKLDTIRVLLSLAANQGWPLIQFDIKNAFLHEDLVEEVYMDPPLGIEKYLETTMVCKLKKALYGLKQSPRAWFGRFMKSMKLFGYKQSNTGHTLFLKHRQGKVTALIIYVDDMVLTADIGMLSCKLVTTPIEQNHKLYYYLGESPTDKVYSDVDWAGSTDDKRSTLSYFTFVGGNLITWRSKKQPVVARSSVEAKYRGMVFGVCELLWLKKLFEELDIDPQGSMNLYCDNTSTVEIARYLVQHDCTKHIEVDRHFIKEKLEAGTISLPFVKYEDQLADIITKAVSSNDKALCKLGMCDIHAQLKGE
ncbi:hypothetical protein CXB51_014525 [Gossypium anomalum]|uniref:Reverse transcriptase Ty1/copia-type domain-containing protein n=1 Tax=Gossypium anomalum TaxID=47600 RepID=A0A8J5ZLI4_9ROSI|nr:hypothetical protein CXB51_014525 [Gossypium anomalum]